jgi:hypothetical protein
MMATRERLLRQLAALAGCQAEIRSRATGYCEQWLTPQRIALLEAALVSTGFFLGILILIL